MSPEEEQSISAAGGGDAVPTSETSEAGSNAPESSEAGNLLSSMDPMPLVAQGAIVQGKVLKVTGSEVLVDVGLKCEAAIPSEEFLSEGGEIAVAPGDTADVMIEHYDEAAGTARVSHRKAASQRAWEEIEQAFLEQRTLQGRAVERIKGGLAVDIGVRAFLPGSHSDTRLHCNLESLLGQEIPCKVIKLNRKRGNVVVSRKLALEEEQNRRKSQLLERIVEGAELVGKVKNLTDYGAFVDLGGMDGLLHVTDLSWNRITHPSEAVQVGQEIRVKVLKFDREKERISLGLKQLSPDPWEHVPSTYLVGDRIFGRVVSITDYGVFVELEPGIEGLIHISEMTWSRRLRHPSKIVNVNDRVEVAVLEVNPEQRRISLSLKQALPDPWQTLDNRLAVGVTVEGRVRNLTEFGAFIEIEEGVDGLIHLKNLSNKRVNHPSEVLKKGQRVEAVVLGLDTENRRLSLGLKQLQPDVWEEFFSKTKVEDILKGRVSRMASFGAFVELQDGIEGLCHISEFGEDEAGRTRTTLEIGGEMDFRVIRLNPSEKKIGLSLQEVSESSPASSADRRKEFEESTRSTVMAEALSASGITAEKPRNTKETDEANPQS